MNRLRKEYEDLLEDEKPEELEAQTSEEPYDIDFSYLLSNKQSKDLTQANTTQLYELNRDLIPEAFDKFYYRKLTTMDQALDNKVGDVISTTEIMKNKTGAPKPRPKSKQQQQQAQMDLWRTPISPGFGCRGLQREFVESKSGNIMHRQITQQLTDLIKSKNQKQIYLDGPAGSGKSIIIVALVERLRMEGWLVLYMPQGLDFTYGGMFVRNERTGLWDTPFVAKQILRSILEGHQEEFLKSIPCKSKNSKYATIYELCYEGVESAEAAVNCMAAVQLKEELNLQDDVSCMIAIDGYNALHYQTEYGIWSQDKYQQQKSVRRTLYPIELTVCRNFQVLQDPKYFTKITKYQNSDFDDVSSDRGDTSNATDIPQQLYSQQQGNAVNICAASYNLVKPLGYGKVSRDTEVKFGKDTKKIHVKRYNLYELQAMIDNYALNGWIGIMPDWWTLQKLAVVSGCHGDVIRRHGNYILEDFSQYYDVLGKPETDQLFAASNSSKLQKNTPKDQPVESPNVNFQGNTIYRGWELISKDGQQFLRRTKLPQIQDQLTLLDPSTKPMYDPIKYS